METPPDRPSRRQPVPPAEAGGRRPIPIVFGPGEALAWVSALVFALSSFMSWYSTSGRDVTISVIGWHTGALGKLVFFTGLAALVLLVLRATGLELPPTVPVGAIIAGIGALGTIFIVVRLIDIPDRFEGAGRGIGIWIGLLAGLLLVAAGLLRANEELQGTAARER